MNILILGYSRLVKKRILNVLLKNNIRFSIASKSSTRKVKKAYSWYRNYRIALDTSNADLVYVSLPNSQHYYWAKKALEKGYHVIVDKTLSENFLQAKNLIKIAKNKKKLIAEATFFNYHNQFNKAVKLLNGVKNASRSIILNISIKSCFVFSEIAIIRSARSHNNLFFSEILS